jgi:hypothetical protein
MRIILRRFRSCVRDRMAGGQEGYRNGELGSLVLGRVRVQLGLGNGYVVADARDTRLSLHAVLGQRGTICVDADRDTLEAGHRDWRRVEPGSQRSKVVVGREVGQSKNCGFGQRCSVRVWKSVYRSMCEGASSALELSQTRAKRGRECVSA